MAYFSTAGMTTNATTHFGEVPPRVQLLNAGGLTNGRATWTYTSSHSHTDIESVGFFADGKRHGLKLGDLLINAAYSTAGSSAATMHVVSASTGAVAASDTAGSSAWGQAYNVTVTPATT